ncbi:conserved Plasmodium membrane protein, unknown function [Plasmodium gallinaceum]|uniref:Uncharacterized protein n=1 Tax=Plasmodium gallinaceum TaxID=5849 RepID=A0A1J1GXQ6_PLAGA|nr:conserved Plasmodium membrane protein, unknown function [Plasmodium gallinaceum]CRG97244.1 conserved Plasmodium membrane protein, unknown function [Plasmodium gallinaceum]
MEDLEIKQALFKKENEQNNEKCEFCKTRYRKFINKFLSWEIVLLLTHILVFLIIIYKLIMDKKLRSSNNKLFRSFNSIGHFTQGFLFVVLLVPFKFTKKITKFLINTSEKKDIQENVMRRNVDIENSNKSINITEEKEIKFDSNEEANSITNNENLIDKNKDDELTEYLSDENKLEKKISLEENSTQEKKKRVYFNENISVKEGYINNDKINKNTENSVCDSFVNKLVFCDNVPNYKKKEIEYFFLCAKLFSSNKSYILFVIKYVTSFILMFAYPLYNLIKRKILYKYFYFSSYYINLYDFASGLSVGSSLVLIYGLTKFFISYFVKSKKGETFKFYDNYAFVNDINCLCDENIKINVKNNPYLKNITMNYFNSYHNYKNLLFAGLIILSIICIFSFGFSFISLNTYKLSIK